MNQRNKRFTIIGGPCVIENERMSYLVATKMRNICDDLGLEYVFKSSFYKANRTSGKSFTGIGDTRSHEIFKNLKSDGHVITTDFHESDEPQMYADVVDIAQIPAFLCRQTSLLETCAHYYKTVNIKKGQMCDAKTMEYQGAKLRAIDSEIEIWMTERGNTFGYGDLVVDMRNIQGLKFMGCDKVIFDATHSCQMPNQGEVTGGNDYYSGVLCRAAVAAGCHGIFVEVHPMPDTALSDAATQLPLDDIESWIITNIIPYLTEINHD